MVVGLVLMAMFTIYPIFFTVWVSTTNYGESHLITKKQAVDQILNYKYLPQAGKAYTWTAFKTPEGDYALWLIDSEGTLGNNRRDPHRSLPDEAGIES
jgi:maltose/maltodextrin transport system permease protein/arabinogalactan oligomer/maltooligosaccharide transport system permease protein